MVWHYYYYDVRLYLWLPEMLRPLFVPHSYYMYGSLLLIAKYLVQFYMHGPFVGNVNGAQSQVLRHQLIFAIVSQNTNIQRCVWYLRRNFGSLSRA